jgi:hypothetical protein
MNEHHMNQEFTDFRYRSHVLRLGGTLENL